jgi:lysophospholipase L1-like esterase
MIQENLASMAEIAVANDIRVILASVLPVYDYPWAPGLEPAQRIVALNKWIEDYAEDNGHVYLDYYWELVDERGGMAAPFTTDGVHVSKAGYEVMQGLAEAAIAESLGRKLPDEENGGLKFEPIRGCASNVRIRSRRGDCD